MVMYTDLKPLLQRFIAEEVIGDCQLKNCRHNRGFRCTNDNVRLVVLPRRIVCEEEYEGRV